MRGRGVLVVLLSTLWLTPAFAPPAFFSFTLDDTDDVYDFNKTGFKAPGYADIIFASVTRIGNRLYFLIQVAGEIPPFVDHYLSYQFQLDTDMDPSTGMFLTNDIGVDYGFRIWYDLNRGWVGEVGTYGRYPMWQTRMLELRPIPKENIIVRGNTVLVVLTADMLGCPWEFNWVAAALEYWVGDNSKPNFHDHAPSQGHVTSFIH